MHSFFRSKRTAIIGCAAGAVVLAGVGVGGAAFADGAPSTPSTSASQVPSAPSGAPTAPGGAEAPGGAQTPTGTPAAPPKGGPSGGPAAGGPAGKGGPEAKHEPHIGGTVRSVDGDTVTVQDRDGFTRTIHLDDDATVTKDGAKASASDITKGAHVEATGLVDSNGTTLDATSVMIGQPQPPEAGEAPAAPAAPAAPDATSTPSASTPTGS